MLVPEAFGDTDTPEARAGTTIYLGVNVPGALFSIGDGHYTMGEGEVCGVAVEGAMDTVLTVDLSRVCPATGRASRTINRSWSRARTAHSKMPSHRPYPAHRLDLQRHGVSLMDAYQLVTQG